MTSDVVENPMAVHANILIYGSNIESQVSWQVGHHALMTLRYIL